MSTGEADAHRLAASASCRRLVEAAVGDRDAVDVPRPLGADLALEHVAQHPLGVALLGRPVAAAAAGAEADHVAGDEVERRLRDEPRLDAVADVHVLGDPPGVAAERAPRACLVAVGEDGEGRVQVEEVVLAQPEPAAEAARPLGVLDEREAVDPHRVVELRLLDRRVLGVLAVRLDGVGAVARVAAAVAAGERVVEARVLAGARRRGSRSPPGTSSPSSPRAAARGRPAAARGRSPRSAARASPSRRRPGRASCVDDRPGRRLDADSR